MASGAEITDSLQRPVTSVYSLGIGSSSAIATYLSPLRYSGRGFSAIGHWAKAVPSDPRHLVMQFDASAEYMNMLNQRKNAAMLGVNMDIDWHLFYRFHPVDKLQVAVGGGPDVAGGLLYLPKNGNNPISVNAAVSLDLAASASWRMKIGALPVMIVDEVKMPSIGAFFSQQYGETFYEIYLGNHSGLIHCGWWGNRFGIDNELSFSIDFGRTAMRLGYKFSFQSQSACDLYTRTVSHSFVIGVIPGGLGMKNKRKAVYAGY